jgi:hypothetical protein
MNWPQAFVAATAIVSLTVLLLATAVLSGVKVTWATRAHPIERKETPRDPGK